MEEDPDGDQATWIVQAPASLRLITAVRGEPTLPTENGSFPLGLEMG